LTCIAPYDVAMKSVQLLEVELAFVISSHGWLVSKDQMMTWMKFLYSSIYKRSDIIN
jgi:hypothetical protein